MTQDANLAALIEDMAKKVEQAATPAPSPRAEAAARAMTLINRLDDDELERLLIGLETGELP